MADETLIQVMRRALTTKANTPEREAADQDFMSVLRMELDAAVDRRISLQPVVVRDIEKRVEERVEARYARDFGQRRRIDIDAEVSGLDNETNAAVRAAAEAAPTEGGPDEAHGAMLTSDLSDEADPGADAVQPSAGEPVEDQPAPAPDAPQPADDDQEQDPVPGPRTPRQRGR